MTVPRIFLRKGSARPVWAGHPVVYDGSIERVVGRPSTGDEVDVLDHAERFLGRGVFHADAPVRVRVFRDDEGPIDDAFLASRVRSALTLRRDLLRLPEVTDAYRLIHGDGDRLPGVTADVYAGWIVLTVANRAVADRRAALANALLEGIGAKGVWERAQPAFAEAEGFAPGGGRLAGDVPPDEVDVVEHGVTYRVDVRGGAKTGHFLDQRDNRLGFAALCGDRTVLDAFSGTGGFGLSALVRGQARTVTALDVSPRALERLAENASANGVADRITAECGDGFKLLRALCDGGRTFGAVSLDPPRFATSRREVEGALRGYRELNLRALTLIEPDGLLATSSCTSVVDLESFLRVIRDAAADAGRRVQVLRISGQAPDHPWLTAVPEGRYLKHVLLRVLAPS